MVKEGIVLRHLVSARGIKIDQAKIEVIEKLTPLTTTREVRSFLGHASFCRPFIKDFSKISKLLTRLLMKDAKFDFNNECLESFRILKKILISTSIIQSLSWSAPFKIMCDAGDYALDPPIITTTRKFLFSRKTSSK